MSTPFSNLLGPCAPDPAGRGQAEPAWPYPSWLPQSWQQPREFFAALFTEATAVLGGPQRSQLAIGVNWYRDLVQRHLSRLGARPAVRWYDETKGWQTLTLSELDARAGALAAVLAERGAAAGDLVALVLPSGGPLLIGLLAALRLGCCAVPVLPLGGAYVRSLLAASRANWVVTCTPYTALPGLLEHQPIVYSAALLQQAGEPPRSASYPPEAPLWMVQSPLRPALTWSVMTAGDAYAAALRDGLLILGLRPGDTLIVPATPQQLPASYLTTLLCGAGILEISEPAAQQDAGTLLREPARAALLTQSLAELLAARPAGPARWGCWFRDPQEPLDAAAWERAAKQLHLKGIPHANLVWDAAAGGAVLGSTPHLGPPHPYAAPVPGCQHVIAALHGQGPAVTAAGKFVLLGEDGKSRGSPGEALLVATGAGYVYAGTAAPRRAGWSFPTAAALAVLAEAPQAAGLVGASFLELAGGGAAGQALVVLVLFTGATLAEDLDAAPFTRLLVRELGPAARPDRVEAFPLYPRRVESAPTGPIDEAWVRGQYLSGELYRKSRAPVFQALTKMRAALLPLMTARGQHDRARDPVREARRP